MAQAIGVLIAATVAFFVVKDASKRGMNAWVWGVGVFCLLIIVLPIYFIVRKPKLK
jgi:hypothetical protein